MTLGIRRGLVVFAIGLPLFFGLRVAIEWVFGRDIDFRHDLIWAFMMALVFGILGLFQKGEME